MEGGKLGVEGDLRKNEEAREERKVSSIVSPSGQDIYTEEKRTIVNPARHFEEILRLLRFGEGRGDQLGSKAKEGWSSREEERRPRAV